MDLSVNIQQQLRQAQLLDKPILVAVSTGVDSMVLLDLLQQNLPKNNLHVAYVDHQLRAQSQRETEFIKFYCQKNDLTLHMTKWPKSLHPQSGIEAQARIFRYNFFAQVMQQEKIAYLLTAHHGDDQLETWLMKLLRGGQLEQLTGIRQVRHFAQKYHLVRLLLEVEKQQLLDYAKQRQLTWFDDETNTDDTYLRNRLRKYVTPQLKKENPAVINHLNSYGQQIADLLLLQQQVYQHLKQTLARQQAYSLAAWQALAPNQQRLFVKCLCQETTLSLAETQLTALVRFLNNATKPQGIFNLTANTVVYKDYAYFGIKPLPKDSLQVVDNTEISLQLGKMVKLDEQHEIGLFLAQEDILGDKLYLTTLPNKLVVRHRHLADKLLTKDGRQKVKKILIDQKIPQAKRDKLWLVADQQENIYWIIGIKKSNLARGQKNAKIQYMIVYRDLRREG